MARDGYNCASYHPLNISSVSESILVTFTPTATDAGKRLDQYLLEMLPAYSRARLQHWVKSGNVAVDGRTQKPSYTVHGTERIEVTPLELPPLKAEAEDIPLEVLYEDASVIAIDKPAGMVVHAGAGNHTGTLVNALIHRFQALSTVGGDLRPGIVHRLDRYTSGVILVARDDASHRHLAAQFARRSVKKIYHALVHGVMKSNSGHIEKPIARDPVHRTKMTARLATGRPAISDYRVLQRFEKHTLVEVAIGTGRTHQIRVHLSSIGHPVVGDSLYGAPALPRFFLHARRITFESPASGENVTVESPLPTELNDIMDSLAC